MQILDRIVIVVALTGALIRFGNFMNSEIIGKPTHSDNGVVFVREVTDALTYDPHDNGWIQDLSYDKDNSREMLDGYVPITLNVFFNNKPSSEQAVKAYLGSGIKNVLVQISEHIHQAADQPLNYSLEQKQGRYIAHIQTYGVARQPSQLYESISSLLLFIFLFIIWNRKKKETKEGVLFGLFLVILFTLRFVYEFSKENQVAFEDKMTLNMGQWLSIPFVIIGIIVLIRAYQKKPEVKS